MSVPSPTWVVNNKTSNLPLRYVDDQGNRLLLPAGTIIVPQLLAADVNGQTSPTTVSPLGTVAVATDNVSVDITPTVVSPPLRGYAVVQATITLPVPGPNKSVTVFVLFIDNPALAFIEAETNMITTR
jgi:hypothetical protein